VSGASTLTVRNIKMMVPGSSYWNLGIARNPGEFAQDEEGIATMRNLGRNMAWLLKKISA